jgi:hypothetical protein
LGQDRDGAHLVRLQHPAIFSHYPRWRSGARSPDEFGFAMIVVGLLALLLAALKHWSDIRMLKLQ